jgi:hypothetical protein
MKLRAKIISENEAVCEENENLTLKMTETHLIFSPSAFELGIHCIKYFDPYFEKK